MILASTRSTVLYGDEEAMRRMMTFEQMLACSEASGLHRYWTTGGMR